MSPTRSPKLLLAGIMNDMTILSVMDSPTFFPYNVVDPFPKGQKILIKLFDYWKLSAHPLADLGYEDIKWMGYINRGFYNRTWLLDSART